YNMEGPPRRSSSLPAANVTCLTEDDQRIGLGDNKEYHVIDNSIVMDSAANQRTPNDIPKAVICDNGKYMVKAVNGTAMDDVNGENAMDSSNYAKAGCADHLNGICATSHGLVGTNHEVVHICSVTNDVTAANLNEETHEEVQQPDEIPASTTTPAHQPAIMSIEVQALQHVNDAKEAYQQFKVAVETANDMLKKMSKPHQQISEDLIADIELCLTDSPGWFLSVMNGKDRKNENLQEELNDVNQRYSDAIIEIDELRLKLGEPLKSMGLSVVDKKRLRSVGVDNLNDLINNYRQLQIDLAAGNKASSADIKVNPTLSRSNSSSSLDQKQQWQQQKQTEPGRLSSTFTNVGNSGRVSSIPIPMPEKFIGKTRIELDRYFRYFDQAVNSRGYPDADKAIMLGNYVPCLQYEHDKLLQEKSTYAEVKAGLLNALGSDSDVTTFALRTSLDRVKKSDDKLYKNLLATVEKLVTEAFNGDIQQGDVELKKILIRLTEEDSNPIFGSTIIPHTHEKYSRLKELILGVERGLLIKKESANQLKADSKPSLNKPYPSYQKRFYPPRSSFPSRDTRSYGSNQRDQDRVFVHSRTTEVESFPSNPNRHTSANKQELGQKSFLCFNCKKPGHYANDCPEQSNQNVRQIKHIGELRMNGVVNIANVSHPAANLHMFGQKAMLDIFLDGAKVTAMLDSGACASIISEAAVGRILRRRPAKFQRITEENPESYLDQCLVSANGSPLDVVNCLRIEVALPNKAPKLAKFFVVPGLQQEILIGTNVLQDDDDWLEALTDSLRTGKREQSCKTPNNTTVINTIGNKVNVASRTVVPPHTTVFLKVEVLAKGNVILEANTEGLETGFYILQVFEKGEYIADASSADIVSDITAPTIDSEDTINVVTDNVERIERLKDLLNRDAPGFSSKGKARLQKLLEKYNMAFAVTDDEFGRTSVCEHTIDTGDARPIRQPARPIPLPMKHEVKSLIESLRDQKAIEESSSEWNSPLVLVRKKDGTVRICVDYRKLNDITKKDAYPLPNQDALLMNLKGKKIFTALDMVSGYFQIPMAAADKHKTAFSALGKLWQFLVLPQGLATSPAAFSRMMEVVFGDLVGRSLFKFLDDILIATETEEEHLQILEEVFKRLIQYNLKLKPKKCEVAKTTLVYLGHVISADGVAVGQDKIDKVMNFPIPTSVTQVRQFLGLASYHRKFIEGFAKIAAPLIVLTRKNIAFHWNEEEQQSFDQLKDSLVKAPVLSQPDYEAAIEGSKPFVIWTDACKTGVGAVLTQQDDDGNFHPLFYISKACSAAERNYSITQLEALAVVVAMRKLKTFVMGAKVLVRTDHQPLVGLLKKGNLSPQLIRWALELQEYQELTIQFVKGKFNVVADALSRCHSDSDCGEHIEVMESVVLLVENKTSETWFDMLKIDPFYNDICEKVLISGIIKIGRDEYTVTGGFLLKTDEKGHTVKIVPREIRKFLWEDKHSGLFGGHFGTKKIKTLLRYRYYWNNMGNDLAEWSKACMQCFAHGSHRRDRPPLHPIKTDLPMQIVGMDIAEMPNTEKGYKNMLVIIDHFTKYASAYPLHTKSAEEVAKVFLEKWCLREQRFPRQVISDMGREFDNKLLSRITELTNIESIFSLGYNSQFNGLSERFIQTMKKVLAKRINETTEWSDVLPFALFAYNTVPHEATGETPHFLLHGFDAFVPSDIDPADKPTVYQTDLQEYKHQVLENLYAAQAFVREKLEYYCRNMEKEYNGRKRTHPTTLAKGDIVFIELPTERVKNALSKLAPRLEGPARITEVGETTRRTRVRNVVNSIVFSESKTRDQLLSENYGCPQETCLLTIGLVLPNSPYSEKVAFSCRDLVEKVAVAMSSQMTEEEKESTFKKADDMVARPGKIHISADLLRTTWKAVLQKCTHQAEAFKECLGKSLEKSDVEDMDMVLEMVAHLNNINYMIPKNMDTVVVGGENAKKLKNAINANYWPMLIPQEAELRARVVFGCKIKRIIYVPPEKLIYGNGAQFESATRIILQTLNYLDQCNDCEVIMLPVLRHLDYPEMNQKFLQWYKESAASDPRFIGCKEVDEMKLIHWLHATPSNKDETEHVDANGILKELGTQKLVQYLAHLGFPWTHRVLLQPENVSMAATPSPQHGSSSKEANDLDRASLRHQKEEHGNYRRITNDRGRKSSRGSKRKWPNDRFDGTRSSQVNRDRRKEKEQ
uniref:Reverse transcriptase n=1 Tax=Panagrolaimus sp. ES5 TaxID=591445 RepID=A0AC34FIH0_9BILA